MATGIRTRHARSCRSREGGGCNCTPSYQAQAYDPRTGRQVWRTFPTLSAAKLWRQDAQVALRRGTMRPPTAKTIAEAAEILIAGAHDGTILDRGGKPYKPSTARGYEQLLHVIRRPGPRRPEALAGPSPRRPGLRRRLAHAGPSASTIANILDPLRVIFRRAIRRDEVSIDPTDNLDLPAIRGRRTGSNPRSARTSSSPRCPTPSEPSGPSRCSVACAAASCAACSGSTRLRGRRDPRRAIMGPGQGPVDVKTGAGRRAVPMAFVVRRELMAHKRRTGRHGPRPRLRSHRYRGVLRVHHPDPGEQGVEPSRLRAAHPARGPALRDHLLHRRRTRLEADLDLGRTRRRPPDLEPIRPPRPGRRTAARQRLDAFLTPPTPPESHAHCGARPQARQTPVNTGALKYRYRDSNPGFRRERALSSPVASGNVRHLQGKLLNSPIDTAARCTRDVCCECADRSDLGGRITAGDYDWLQGARMRRRLWPVLAVPT